MELGLIGLGRMGSGIALRLVKSRHRVVGYARTRETVERHVKMGIEGAYSLEELVKSLNPPRAIWIMIPAGAPVDKIIEGLNPFVEKGDILIDGGNSYYKDTIRRARMADDKGLHYLDVGVSGGIWGLKEGYSLMIGGKKEVFEHLRSVFETLAPAKDKGWGRVGQSGAGHFVKMVHNGIEYGLMEAYAEGFELMKKKKEFELDLHNVAEIWRHGSVVRSWLLDLASQAFAENPKLEGVPSYVEDSGEGRWTVIEGIDLNVALPVITLALQRRFDSRNEDEFSYRLLAALRNKFGGHAFKRFKRDERKRH